MSHDRLHVCLGCVFIGCYPKHLYSHAQSSHHNFAMDFNHGQVYCIKCKDYIYHPEIDRVTNAETVMLDIIVARVLEPNVEHPVHRVWMPNANQVQLIKEKSRVSSCAGLRGLCNMGATCFMNTILQTLIHNPMMKAYFLSGMHVAKDCGVKSCLACEMDGLFCQVYSTTDRSPYCPTSFLFNMWISQKHLAGYSQQDAHEFFISVLNEMHNNCGGREEGCNCIVHQTFGGILQSDVTCTACSKVSSAYDPTLDISIDINSAILRTGAAVPELNLQGCIDGYTAPEMLVQYNCKSCQSVNQATKRLSFKQLPQVISVQLKRFKHNATTSSKIEADVRIPAELDMTPYTIAWRQRNKTFDSIE